MSERDVAVRKVQEFGAKMTWSRGGEALGWTT